jgi:hypothetical protein
VEKFKKSGSYQGYLEEAVDSENIENENGDNSNKTEQHFIFKSSNRERPQKNDKK